MKADGGINSRILEARKALGLSQKDFAEGLNVSRTYAGALEQWGQNVNERIISIISMTYGINKTWLKDGTGKMFDKKPANQRLEKLCRNFEKLDIFLQDYILKQVDTLLDFQNKKGIK